mmetsp:Transcript_1295/g.1891  ORF Transcript_1295/g.1891 Transcript_1295/m.1891 type:complete len:109 (-) Transcript_1295:64-390(-)
MHACRHKFFNPIHGFKAQTHSSSSFTFALIFSLGCRDAEEISLFYWNASFRFNPSGEKEQVVHCPKYWSLVSDHKTRRNFAAWEGKISFPVSKQLCNPMKKTSCRSFS